MNWSLYFFVKLDDIRQMLEVNMDGVLLSCFILIAVASLAYFLPLSNCEGDETKEFVAKYGKYYRNAIIFCAALIMAFSTSNIASALLPSTGQMAAIYFGDAALKSETAEIVQRMPPKLANILNSKLNEWIQENTKPIEMIDKIENKERL